MLPEKDPAFGPVFPGTPKKDERTSHQQTYLHQPQPDTQNLRIEGNQGSKDDKKNRQIPEGFRAAPRATA